ncbi:MAG: TIM barrel protein [Caldilineaceae bacterium]
MRTMRVFSGNAKPGYELEQGLAWIVDGLGAGAEYAAQHGVTLALENHGLMAGRSDQVRRIIDAVGSPALRANIDTGNFLLVNQNPTDAARIWPTWPHWSTSRISAVPGPRRDRACLQGLDGTGFTGAVVGQGEVDLPAIVEILRGGLRRLAVVGVRRRRRSADGGRARESARLNI